MKGPLALRWYPRAWRDRYGDELRALIEDLHGDESVPFSVTVALARGGLVERWREFAGTNAALSAPERARAGALSVLLGWSLFVVAGGIFAKFADGWRTLTPSSARLVPSLGYAAVVAAATVAALVTVVAALSLLPVLVRLVRDGAAGPLTRPVALATGACATAAVLTAGAVWWSRHLSEAARNGGSTAYSLYVLLALTSIAVAVPVSARGVMAVVAQLPLSPTRVRALSRAARVVAMAVSVVGAGVATWWISLALSSPQVLRAGIGNGVAFRSSVAPPTLLVMLAIMLIGGFVVAVGCRTITTSLRESDGWGRHARDGGGTIT